MNNYYLYRHIRLDTGMPFYIGVGTKGRFKKKYGRNEFWRSIYKEVNGKIRYEIMLDELNVLDAYEKEREFISLYGRIDLNTGTLTNLTGGGTGLKDCSPILKEKISKANTGQKRTDEARNSFSQAKLGKNNPMYGDRWSQEKINKRKEMISGQSNPNYRGILLALDIETKKVLFEFKDVEECKKFLNLSPKRNLSQIYACIKGRNHTAFGYKWARKEENNSTLEKM